MTGPFAQHKLGGGVLVTQHDSVSPDPERANQITAVANVIVCFAVESLLRTAPSFFEIDNEEILYIAMADFSVIF